MNYRPLFAFGLASVALVRAVASDTPPPVRIDLDGSAPAAAQPTPSTTTAKKGVPAKPAAGAPAKTKAGDKKKKEEPPPKIDGIEVSRGERGFLGVKLDGNTFKISFYNREKKPMPVDVTGAALRWPVKYQPNDERAFLTPVGDGKALGSDKIVKPPYVFKLYITLLTDASSGGETPPAETYVIDFHQ